MHLAEKGILIKLKNKNRGNAKLMTAIDRFIFDFEESENISPDNLHQLRKDADKIHSDGIYFFNIHIHRVMLLIEFSQNRAVVLWSGSHDEYINKFKNNKDTIEKWLRANQHIQ